MNMHKDSFGSFTTAVMPDTKWNAQIAAFTVQSRWREVIDKAVEHGTMPPPDVPWGDHRFQSMIVQALHRGSQWKDAADKLAVIKEVFGGGAK